MPGSFIRFKQWVNRWIPEKSKVQFFLVFIGISALFWGLTRLSNNYTTTVVLDMNYDNIPEDVILKKAPTSVVATVEASGFQLLLYKTFGQEITVDLESVLFDETTAKVDLLLQRNFLETQLFENGRITLLNPSTVGLEIQRLETKRVPVSLVSQIEFKKGFNYTAVPTLQPDTVSVIGIPVVLNEIASIRTIPLVKSGLDRNFSETLRLEIPNGVNALSHRMVVVTAKTTKFTEMTYEIPLLIINKAVGQTIRLFPQSIKITGRVPLALVDSVQASDFSAYIDISQVERDSETLPVFIEKQSPLMRSMRWSPKQVNFLIRQ